MLAENAEKSMKICTHAPTAKQMEMLDKNMKRYFYSHIYGYCVRK